jgi:hypothetical protein
MCGTSERHEVGAGVGRAGIVGEEGNSEGGCGWRRRKGAGEMG